LFFYYALILPTYLSSHKYTLDQTRLFFQGHPLLFTSPSMAFTKGISTQPFSFSTYYIPSLTHCSNLFTKYVRTYHMLLPLFSSPKIFTLVFSPTYWLQTVNQAKIKCPLLCTGLSID
jgi:hypothetical protein